MSNQTARDKLIGHGKVLCEECGRVIITCKCIQCSENILYDVCDDCEKLFMKKETELTSKCPECGEDLIEKWSGVKCGKCGYWFCY